LESQEKKSVLLLFVKNLEKGKVKTRLAKTVGNEKALNIYKKLIRYTCRQIAPLNADKQVWYAWYLPDVPICKEDATLSGHIQQGNSLGERMSNAFRRVFEQGYQKAVIIGSDCAELETRHLEEAYHALDIYDTVIGPASDGGYYLLGMRHFLPEIFSEVTWSSKKVFDQTIKNIDNSGHSWTRLEMLTDIDNEEDWQAFSKKISDNRL